MKAHSHEQAPPSRDSTRPPPICVLQGRSGRTHHPARSGPDPDAVHAPVTACTSPTQSATVHSPRSAVPARGFTSCGPAARVPAVSTGAQHTAPACCTAAGGCILTAPNAADAVRSPAPLLAPRHGAHLSAAGLGSLTPRPTAALLLCFLCITSALLLRPQTPQMLPRPHRDAAPYTPPPLPLPPPPLRVAAAVLTHRRRQATAPPPAVAATVPGPRRVSAGPGPVEAHRLHGARQPRQPGLHQPLHCRLLRRCHRCRPITRAGPRRAGVRAVSVEGEERRVAQQHRRRLLPRVRHHHPPAAALSTVAAARARCLE
jgi:hypothetical protein